MRVKPDLQDASITDCLHNQYGLKIVEVTFLPSGGDTNAAVYRVVTTDGTRYFLKFRRGDFDETSITVPCFLKEQGIQQIIAPIPTQSHQLWTHLENFHVILYPFVEGQNGFQVALTEQQWIVFGTSLKAIHTAVMPAQLSSLVPYETYSSHWREMVKMLQERVKKGRFDDPLAAQYAELMAVKADEITYLVQKAEQLSSALQAQDLEFVLCHSDIHAGNLLIDGKGSIYIVDWDNPILAPKERDLMFICGGVGSTWYSPQEEAWFYQGYGQEEINPTALAYYRFERIVEDIASFAEKMLLTDMGGKDRARWLKGLARWFQPNEVVEMAHRAAITLPPELQSDKP